MDHFVSFISNLIYPVNILESVNCWDLFKDLTHKELELVQSWKINIVQSWTRFLREEMQVQSLNLYGDI